MLKRIRVLDSTKLKEYYSKIPLVDNHKYFIHEELDSDSYLIIINHQGEIFLHEVTQEDIKSGAIEVVQDTKLKVDRAIQVLEKDCLRFADNVDDYNLIPVEFTQDGVYYVLGLDNRFWAIFDREIESGFAKLHKY